MVCNNSFVYAYECAQQLCVAKIYYSSWTNIMESQNLELSQRPTKNQHNAMATACIQAAYFS